MSQILRTIHRHWKKYGTNPQRRWNPCLNSNPSWAPNSLPWKEKAFQNTENWLFTLQIYFVFIDLTMEAKKKKKRRRWRQATIKKLNSVDLCYTNLGPLPNVPVAMQKNGHKRKNENILKQKKSLCKQSLYLVESHNFMTFFSRDRSVFFNSLIPLGH